MIWLMGRVGFSGRVSVVGWSRVGLFGVGFVRG